MFLAVVALAAGIAVLAVAADQFVLGAARISLLRKIPPLVVGVVVIGFGTSAPELLVSALAAAGDEPEVAVGNIVGSNLANLSFLLGVGAIFVPLRVESRVVRREVPLAIGAMLAFTVVVQGDGISNAEGVVLLVAMALVLYVVARGGATDPIGSETSELVEPEQHTLGREAIRTGVALLLVVGSAQAVLWGALELAAEIGLSEGFVGATIVAMGTSLPELVTVVQSARRQQTDLIVGNLLGSNLFNSLAVGGVAGIIGANDLDAPELTGIAATAALVAGAAAAVMMVTGYTVTRREGLALVAAYLAVVPFLA